LLSFEGSRWILAVLFFQQVVRPVNHHPGVDVYFGYSFPISKWK
jgi:hypothetical protein